MPPLPESLPGLFFSTKQLLPQLEPLLISSLHCQAGPDALQSATSTFPGPELHAGLLGSAASGVTPKAQAMGSFEVRFQGS